MNRGQQSNEGRPSTIFSAGAPNEPEHQAPKHADHKQDQEAKKTRFPVGGNTNLLKWGGGVGVIVIAILIAATLALLLSFKQPSEANLVDDTKLQAVFLTNNQVYFGKVSSINNRYMVLNSVYYLQTSTADSTNKTAANNSNISLVKLGCELHKPQDRMIISKDQVSFWENLQSDGQVAKAVAQYVKDNPEGQTCPETSGATNPVQGGTSNNTNTTTPTNTGTGTTNDDTTGTN